MDATMTMSPRSSELLRHSVHAFSKHGQLAWLHPLTTVAGRRPIVSNRPRHQQRQVAVKVAAPPAGGVAYRQESPAVRRSASEEAKTHEYGGQTRVILISSSDEFYNVTAEHPTKVIVLMCKAKFCRPCKMFSRKYSKIADNLVDCVFLDVYGDENGDTRKMMMDMQVKATPTFRIYRGSNLLKVVTGANEKKVSEAITAVLEPGEVGYGVVTSAAA